MGRLDEIAAEVVENQRRAAEYRAEIDAISREAKARAKASRDALASIYADAEQKNMGGKQKADQNFRRARTMRDYNQTKEK